MSYAVKRIHNMLFTFLVRRVWFSTERNLGEEAAPAFVPVNRLTAFLADQAGNDFII